MKKRFLAMLLVVCMVLSITPTSTFAEISPQVGEGNVCTHHIHDEKCGYTQALAQVDCDKNCTDTNDDGVIDHAADCAYSPAVAANPCNFDVTSCEICHPKNGETADAGTALPSETPDPALPSETPVLAKTDAPTTAMATVAKETAIQPSVSFVLDNQTAYADTATWAVYDSETATTAREDIVASCNANTLTLAHKTDLPVAVYYVAVTENGKAESARLALTVEGNVAPVAMLGATPATSLGGVALDTKLVSGTTYTVSNADELAKLATLVNDDVVDDTDYVVNLTGNIVLPNSNWTPIGKYVDGANDKPFNGTFDGCGFEVQNLTINNTSADRQGLFGYVGGGGIVQNVGVTGTVSGKENVGGVAGWNNGGTIRNCYSTVNVTGNNGVGGVVGENYTTVKNCYNIGTVSGNNGVGGVMGFNLGTVQNCYNTGTVTGSNKVGGVVGVNLDTVQNCVSLGASNTGSPIGRVVGVNDDSLGKCVLANNQARSDMLVNNAAVTGGAAGNINGADVVVSTATQADVFSGWNSSVWTIPADKLVAGAILPTLNGFKNAQNPTLPAAAAVPETVLDKNVLSLESGKIYTVETKEQLARLATLVNDNVPDGTGYIVKLTTNIDLLNSEWKPIGTYIDEVNNKPFNGTFDGCGLEVQNIKIDNSSADDQGLFGYVCGTVQNVGVTGNVSGARRVGGVVGFNQGTIQNCYSTVNVNGTENVGGVAGWNNGGTIRNCYSTGTVTGTKWVGGVAGDNYGGTVKNCYNTATVSGETSVGGIIGYQGVPSSSTENCVSLGSKILYSGGSTADFGRVVGSCNDGTINNNKARGDMLVNNATVTGGLVDNTNGADVTVGTSLQTEVFASANGWNAGVWTIPADKLVANTALPTLNVFSGKHTPTLPTVVKEEPKPLDNKITTLEPGNIYTIADSEQLARLASLSYIKWVSGYTVKLLNDIDLSTIENWAPIGNSSNNFAGTFDGCGFEVKNLKVSNNAVDYQGLFGYVDSDGIVQNVGVTGTVSGKENVGGVAGWNNGGTIRNCYSTATVTGTNSVGGVAGRNDGVVQNCYSTGNVNGTGTNCYIGGVAGYNGDGSTVQNCYSTATVGGTNSVGGILGYLGGGNIQNCVSLGASVLRADNSVENTFGRVIGGYGMGTLTNNKARSDMLVKNATVTDGAVDNMHGADVVVGIGTKQTDVFTIANGWDATVWTIPVGNLVAGDALPTLKGFSSTQNPKLPAAESPTDIPLTDKINVLIDGNTYTVADGEQLARLASLVNIAKTPVTGYTVKMLKDINLVGSKWTPIGIDTKPFAGTFDGCGHEVQNLTINNTADDNQGLFGVASGTVKNVGVTGTVTSKNNVGSVVCKNSGTVDNCYSTATVNCTENIGGVVGFNEGTVQNCYNSGAVSGAKSIGGVVGNNSKGTVQNCYNTGNVNGTNKIGGIVGNDNGNVKNCYNTAAVTGGYQIGGIVGDSGMYSNIQNCYNTGIPSGGYYVGGILGATYHSTVKNCVSLGLIVNRSSGNAPDLGKVVGYKPSGFLINNKARGDMLVKNAVVDGGALDDINGEPFAVGDGTSQTSVFTAEMGFTTANGWNEISGNLGAADTLPTLAGFVSTQNPKVPQKTNISDSITFANGTAVYNGNVQTLENATTTATGGKFTYTYAEGTGKLEGGKPKSAGTYTVTATYENATEKGSKDATFTIGKSPINVKSGTVTAKTYDGTTTATVTALDFHVLASGDRFTTTDYTIGAANFSDADVGTNKTVTGIATLVANEKTNNYTLTDGAYTLTNGEINKGTYTPPPTKTISIKNGAERTGTITLADIFGANIPTDGAFGTVTAPISNKIMSTVVKSGDNLTYTSKNNAANTTATDIYTVKVTSKNYVDFDVTITFQAIDKTAVAISGLTAETNLVYNGKQQKGCTGTATVEGNKVPVAELMYTYTGTNGTTYNETTAPTNAGSYKLVVAINPTNADYTGKHTDINFTIGKAPLDIKAEDKNILIGEAKPTYTATATGLVNGESLSGVTFTDDATDTSKKGSFTITPTGGTVSGGGIVNYETSYSTGTLFVNVDTSSIDTALAKANTAKGGVITSEGSADTVADGTKFVTAAEMKAIDDAITTATSAKTTVANITDAKSAAKALDDAVATFTKAIKIGTKKVVTPPSPPVAPTATPTIAPTATPTPKATDGGDNTQKPKPTEEKPTTGKTTAEAEVDADGKATVTVPEKSITDAIKKAQQTAKKNGTEENGIAVEIEVTSGENINSVSTTLSEESIKELTTAGVKEVTFKSKMGDITLDLETLEQIQKEQGDITISVSKTDVSHLDENLKEEIGDRPVYELNLTKADGTRVTNFDGSITIAIPYTLQEGEDPANIAVVYINEKGEKEIMSGSGYDEKTQSVIFTTRHFSTFAIVLMPNEIDAPLTDIEQAEDTTTDLGNANEIANTQGGISTGIMVTIVIAGILAIAIVAVGVVAIVKKRKE